MDVLELATFWGLGYPFMVPLDERDCVRGSLASLLLTSGDGRESRAFGLLKEMHSAISGGSHIDGRSYVARCLALEAPSSWDGSMGRAGRVCIAADVKSVHSIDILSILANLKE